MRRTTASRSAACRDQASEHYCLIPEVLRRQLRVAHRPQELQRDLNCRPGRRGSRAQHGRRWRFLLDRAQLQPHPCLPTAPAVRDVPGRHGPWEQQRADCLLRRYARRVPHHQCHDTHPSDVCWQSIRSNSSLPTSITVAVTPSASPPSTLALGAGCPGRRTCDAGTVNGAWGERESDGTQPEGI